VKNRGGGVAEETVTYKEQAPMMKKEQNSNFDLIGA
jgi:hypothetical protein